MLCGLLLKFLCDAKDLRFENLIVMTNKIIVFWGWFHVRWVLVFWRGLMASMLRVEVHIPANIFYLPTQFHGSMSQQTVTFTQKCNSV